jgi:hypothetical protein
MATQSMRRLPVAPTVWLIAAGLACHGSAAVYEVYSWLYFQNFGRWANWTLEVIMQWQPAVGWYPADLLVVRLFTLPVGLLAHYAGLIVLAIALMLYVLPSVRRKAHP